MNEREKKITAARTRLILDKPFLGALVLRLPLEESTQAWCRTTATDARTLYYNPDYIEPLTMEQLQFVLAHEALHCGLSHFARREHRNRHRWDVACDHAVNQMLIDDGLSPPPTALINESFSGMTAEEIYPFILKDTDEEPQDQHLYDGFNEDKNDARKSESQNKPSESDSQQASTGNQTETGQPDSQPPPPLSAQERDELNTQWQQRLVGAAQQAAQAGKMSKSVARLVNRLLHSSVPWRTVLARFMSDCTRTDYNLMRPSQRRAGDAIQPSLYAPKTNIVIALDTSGSIEEDELNTFVTEVNAIKGLVNACITLIACDKELDPAGPWVFDSWEQMSMPASFTGNGGTDFTPVFDWVDRQQRKPDLLVYFTDAKGKFPDKRPYTATLWLVKGAARIPWGQRIQLN